MSQRRYTFDYSLLLKDAGLLAATANAQVSGSDKILDLGAGRVDAVVVIDITAIEVDTGNEDYAIAIQGSSSATFGSNVVTLARLRVGDSSVTGDTVDTVIGRYEVPFCNERPGATASTPELFRYVRVRTVIAGTIVTGINFTAFVAKIGAH